MPQPIFLVGPTCVGKSGIAIGLALKIHAEIVSCDSMQVYKGMDIGTAKPSKEDQKIIPHHMISVVDLTEEYNVARYLEDANSAINDIKKRNKIPLIVGGTGLYYKALVDGLFIGPSGNSEVREKLNNREVQSLYNELTKIDPTSANRIKSQDKRKIIRALEVYYLTGKPISEFQTQWNKKAGEYIIIGLNRNREDLYNRINLRVEKMFKDGLVSEVEKLKDKGLEQNKTARQALGYKEILEYLDGKHTLDHVKELIKQNTRHFAKRQLTWFRKDDRVSWILLDEVENVNIVIDKVEKIATDKHGLTL